MNSIRWLAIVPALLACASPAAAADEFTPVTATPIAERVTAVPGTDRRFHVVYELALTNTKAASARLGAVTVRARRGGVLARFRGARLLAQLRTPLPAPADSLVIEPFAQRLLYVELAFRRRSAIPRSIMHRLAVRAASNPRATEPSPLRYTVAPLRIRVRRPVRLSPPLAGPGWVAANGCCATTSVHRGAVQSVNGSLFNAQRFAIDWVRIGADGRFVAGDPTDVRNHRSYGAPVRAVAPGRVVSALSRLPDQPPGQLPDPATITLETVDGNHVVQTLGDGRYAFYAHLQRGSVTVRPGQRVRRGQMLGRLGNSGNTSAPHLHLHVMDGRSVLGSDGLPFVFDRMEMTGKVSATEFDASASLEGVFSPRVFGRPQPRRDRLPLDLDIVSFR
jgi:peptidase M23-like protein